MEKTIGNGHPEQSEGSRLYNEIPRFTRNAPSGQLVLKPWAKINLYLKILGRRSDGYHEILTLIHPVTLFDELAIKRIQEGLIVNCHTENLPTHDIQDNLVTKAAQLFFNRIGESPGVKISLLKLIPIGGGLGGGSSDAANTLLGLNQLYGYPLTKDILYELCVELGMDVPFFLEPRPALCKGRGEIIERRCDNIVFWCVLVNPGRILSTQEVYKALNLTLTDQKTSDNISRFSLEDIYNDLEDPAIRLCPVIGYIKELLSNAGAIRSFVCGSGSTVCGLAKTKRDAEEVMQEVSKEGSKDWWIRVVSSCI